MEGDYNAYLNGGEYAALTPEAQEAYKTQFSNNVDAAISVERWQLVLFGAIVIGVILVVFGVSYYLCRFRYKLDEDKMKEVLAELDAKHKEETPEPVAEEAAAQ